MTSVVSFLIPASTGIVDFGSFFPEKNVLVGNLFRELYTPVTTTYTASERKCRVFKTSAGENTDNHIRGKFNIQCNVNPNTMCGMLSHLGGLEAWLIKIPKDEESLQMILGYYAINYEIVGVAYIEHYVLDGIEEIKLCVDKCNNWGYQKPMVLVMA